jgi:hypothetical protein
VTVQNSIIAVQAAGEDCTGAISDIFSEGYNIESGQNCFSLHPGAGDQQDVASGSLNLGALANNGGPTWTRALAAGSVAIDAIPIGTNGCTAGTSTDQRGAPRANGAGHGGTACDIGAYENDSSVPTAITLRTLRASPGAAGASPGGLAGLAVVLAAALGAGWRVFRRNHTE